jgi:hypothetical protein
MIHPDTAMHAIRILGIDAANMMTQMAVYKATIEELAELADVVDERSWEVIMSDDEEHRAMTGVMLPPDQQVVLQRILMLINGLR